MWDIESVKVVQRFQGHTGDVLSLDLLHSESGSIFASGVSTLCAPVWLILCDSESFLEIYKIVWKKYVRDV